MDKLKTTQIDIDYHNAVESIFDLRFRAKKEGLKKISDLLKRMDNPHEDLFIVRVVGTNGKGSVCAMLTSILVEAGYLVGTFTSPHLVDFCGRICIDGHPISRNEVINLHSIIWPQIEKMETISEMGPPTFFEFVTALALCHFRNKKVNIAIMEAGIGGMRDATHAAGGELGVITNIAMDHEDVFGKNLTSVIRDKASAVTKSGVVVTCNIDDICSEISEIGREIGFRLRNIRPSEVEIQSIEGDGLEISLETELAKYEGLRIPLIGDFQGENTAAAVLACEELNNFNFCIGKEHIIKGLEKTELKGRMQVIGKHPEIIVDCGHNQEAVRRLMVNVKKRRFRKLWVIFGATYKKDIEGMLQMILVHADHLIVTSANNERALKAEDLLEKAEEAKDKLVQNKNLQKDAQIITADSSTNAIKLALERAEATDLAVICGSVYLAGEALNLLDVFDRK